MHYLIDGYNLLFRSEKENLSLKEQRQSIIYSLNEKISFLKMEVSIVFDAIYQPEEGSQSHFDHLEIFFTSSGVTADDFIINFLNRSRNVKNQVVVTSDKGLMLRVRDAGAKTESPGIFLENLNRIYKNRLRGKKSERKKEIEKAAQVFQAKAKLKKPDDEHPAQGCIDYYQHIFEEKWQAILKEEEKLFIEKQMKKPLLRKPKTLRPIFLNPPLEEPKAANETERWLKIFENNFFDQTSDK